MAAKQKTYIQAERSAELLEDSNIAASLTAHVNSAPIRRANLGAISEDMQEPSNEIGPEEEHISANDLKTVSSHI